MPVPRSAARALLASLPVLILAQPSHAAPKHAPKTLLTRAARKAALHPVRAVQSAARSTAAVVTAVVKVADAPATVLTPAASATFADASGVTYTGIVFDLRGLPEITRSMAPNICGPAPDFVLLYPDRSHVPTPDEVQDESIVRYYVTEDAEHAGVCGSNPLVIVPTAVCGPAKDSIVLSAADVLRMQQADAARHFSRTWKVGFLLPAGH